jgi:hypothetical protein
MGIWSIGGMILTTDNLGIWSIGGMILTTDN